MLLHLVLPSRKVKLALGDAYHTSVENIPSKELPLAHRWPVAVETPRGQSALNKKFALKEFTWHCNFFVLPLRDGVVPTLQNRSSLCRSEGELPTFIFVLFCLARKRECTRVVL